MARTRGFIWLLAGIIIALIAGLVAFQSLQKATAMSVDGETNVGPVVDIVVATRSMPVRSVVTQADVELVAVPVANVPEGALRSIDDALGRLTLTELFTGEPVLAQRLLDPNVETPGGRLSLFLVEDEVLAAVPAADLMSRVGVLKPGDHVDVLFSHDFPANRGPGSAGEDGEEQATFTLLENLTVAALVGGQPIASNAASSLTGAESNPDQQGVTDPQAILLTISPQDILVLKYMIDAGGAIDLVLRSPGVDRPFDTDPVDVDYLIDRYDIPTQIGR